MIPAFTTEAIIIRPVVIGWVALVPLLLGAGPPVVKSAVPAPNLDALFDRADGWNGADGAYSIALSPKQTLWLFSDTWVGKIRSGRRTDATIVNNTVGVQEGAGGRLTFTIARGPDGKPMALIVPADGRGWFWLQAGVADHGRLSLFLNQVEKTNDKSVFGLYVYGTDERRGKGLPSRQMVIARVPAASVSELASWRYFREGVWGEDFRNPSPLVGGVASEYSVTPLGNRYLAVYTEKGLSPRILGRTADHPWGPWSAPAVLYECPETGRDKKLFCYGAKAHPPCRRARS